MHLWRKVLCFSLLILILGSAFSAYSYSNSFKLSQEQKSKSCLLADVDDEDGFGADCSDGSVESVTAISFVERYDHSRSFFSARYITPTSYLQLRMLRI